MSKLLYKLFLVFFISFLNTGIVNSAERGIGDIIVVKNNTSSDKTDFHITVESDTPMNVTPEQLSPDLFVNLADPAVVATVGGNNTNTLTFDWDVSIPVGASIVAGFHAVQEEKNEFTVKSYFTPQNSPTDVPVLGWRVTAMGEVYLNNSYSEDIIFDDLTFTLLDELVLDDLLVLALSDSSGLLSSVTLGTVGAGSELFVGQFMQLDPGDFLTARVSMQFSDSSFSSLTSEQLLIHEGQVPEPTTITMILIGLWLFRKPIHIYGTPIKSSC